MALLAPLDQGLRAETPQTQEPAAPLGTTIRTRLHSTCNSEAKKMYKPPDGDDDTD